MTVVRSKTAIHFGGHISGNCHAGLRAERQSARTSKINVR